MKCGIIIKKLEIKGPEESFSLKTLYYIFLMGRVPCPCTLYIVAQVFNSDLLIKPAEGVWIRVGGVNSGAP